jgi:glycerophosphoryl diester phosphodiesterase
MSIREILAACPFLNIAHRGARSLAPENTLAAAAKAIAAGSPMWELDVAMTRDGELLVIHDSTLERTSDVRIVFPHRAPWNIHDFTLAEIRRLDFGTWFMDGDPFGEIRAGRIPPAELKELRGTPAPTLAEALEFTRSHDWCVNVEIKDLRDSPGHRHVVRGVVSLIDTLSLRDHVVVSSFNHEYLEEARRLDPLLRLGVLTSRRLREPWRILQRLGAFSYHPAVSALAPGEARAIAREGFHVLVWTVNDVPTCLRLMDEEVRGIFTDFPQNLARWMPEPPP